VRANEKVPLRTFHLISSSGEANMLEHSIDLVGSPVLLSKSTQKIELQILDSGDEAREANASFILRSPDCSSARESFSHPRCSTKQRKKDLTHNESCTTMIDERQENNRRSQ